MRNLSRGTWLALAAVAVLPATIALAATSEKGGWHKMSSEGRARLDEGRLALAKAALKLTPDQEKLWAPIETQVRDAFKTREARRDEWKKAREERKADKTDGKRERPNMAERFEKMSQRLSERAGKFKAFSASFSPFYASLNDEQKEVMRPVMRELMPGFGGRGHGGPRWAMGGGWGPDGGPRHHGRHHGFERGGPGDEGPGDGPGGPGMQDDGPDNDGGPATPPAEPDKKG